MILSFRFVFSLMVSRHCDICNDDAGTMMQKFLKSHRQFFAFTLICSELVAAMRQVDGGCKYLCVSRMMR